jgi:hypothetical protein
MSNGIPSATVAGPYSTPPYPFSYVASVASPAGFQVISTTLNTRTMVVGGWNAVPDATAYTFKVVYYGVMIVTASTVATVAALSFATPPNGVGRVSASVFATIQSSQSSPESVTLNAIPTTGDPVFILISLVPSGIELAPLSAPGAPAQAYQVQVNDLYGNSFTQPVSFESSLNPLTLTPTFLAGGMNYTVAAAILLPSSEVLAAPAFFQVTYSPAEDGQPDSITGTWGEVDGASGYTFVVIDPNSPEPNPILLGPAPATNPTVTVQDTNQALLPGATYQALVYASGELSGAWISLFFTTPQG